MIPMIPRLAAALLVAFIASPTLADLISSTPAGGPWHLSGTWIGGIVPDGNDQVLVQGPVVIQGAAACLTLDVTAAGALTSGTIPSTLAAGGAITNAGTIADGPLPFRIEIGGDLTNMAQWTNQKTFFMGAGDHQLNAASGSFESHLALGSAASGDVIVETPFAILGDVNLGSGRMRLEPGCPLTMRGGALSGNVLCHGNEVRIESDSYLTNATLDQAVLVGEVEVASFSAFTGGLTVMGVLQNLRSGGNAAITIAGGLVNHGVVRNDHYGFNVDLSGDLTCDGLIACPLVALDENIHHLAMGPDGELETTIMLPEFVPGTIVADNDIRISVGLALGIDGTMILTPGATLHLADRGSLSGGTVLAGGNAIVMDAMGTLSSVTIDDAVLQGSVTVSINCAFTGGVVVEGTLQGTSFFTPEIAVTGPLLNTGLIQNGPTPVTIRAHGDLTNQGVFTNARLLIDGTEDQAIEIGGGIAVPEIRFESGLQASAYQWFRDGEPMPGETGATLTFAMLGADDSGSYWCDGDGALSRTIAVTATPGAGVPGSGNAAPASTMLTGGRPNPFRGATSIDFVLDRPAPVRLSAFDVAGRLVAVLVDERRSAGQHVVPWQAGDLAPGVYFLRLETGSTRIVRKITRLD